MALFPSTPAPDKITISSISPTLISLTHSLRRQTRRRGGQRWLMDISYPPLSRTEFAPVMAFSVARQGQYQAFQFIPPIYGSTSGSATGNPVISGSHGAGSTVIITTGLVGDLKAGDFIKFNNHSKVYMVVADGSATLNIEPALIVDVLDATPIIYNDVQFTMAFTNDTTQMKVAVNQYVAYNMKLAEAIDG